MNGLAWTGPHRAPYLATAATVALVLGAAAGCGAGDGSGDEHSEGQSAGVAPVGVVSGDLRVDNVGWRTGDRKVAVLLGHAGEIGRASCRERVCNDV